VSPSADLSLYPSGKYKVFIEHANGRAPAKFMAPAGATQVEAAIRARDAGLRPIKSVSKASGCSELLIGDTRRRC
jgi:hypothetical protein